ncbi:MAG TPA: right-handed parallel beta-helix repeat-containing protein [Candidatus Bathyarchaeia archaeon]|nr:right-handed parallel beta-helix repeat-containing protein [Candidatus Bathyarchaeia archaeon]
MRLFSCLLALSCMPALALEFHVSPDDGPAALVQARDAVRAARQAGTVEDPVTIWLHGGVYAMPETFTLTSEDSGTANSPVAYKAAPAESPRLIGGRLIPDAAFQPVTGAEPRVAPEARDSIRCADLKSIGITEYGTLPDRFEGPPPLPELFDNGKPMTLARWPNDGWAHVAAVVESGPAPWRNHASESLPVFEYEGDRPLRWKTAPTVWLEGYWCFDWSSDTIRVGSIDTDQRRITLATTHHYGLGHGNTGPRRFYALNLLEELDAPGEYYLDRDDGQLYFIPPSNDPGAEIILSTLDKPILALDGASHVAIEGIAFEACMGDAIHVTGGSNVLIDRCIVRNTGQGGISVNGGERHTVARCDVHDTGGFGISLSGGDRKTLTPCGHAATDNHIYRVSRRQRTHAYHAHLSGVGVTLAHNLIHDGPHQAIGLSGNDHIIEFNEIHHTGMETDDCGAFYMGRNPSERGSIIRYNFWHHIGSSLAHGSCAIYFDDGDGGQTVFGNVFYKAAGGNFGAVFSHGGHDNVVDNNIFIECKRALGHAPWDDQRWKDYVAAELWQEKLLKEVDITKPPYIDRYPDLKDFMTPQTCSRPRVNYASRNIFVACTSFYNGNWEIQDCLATNEDPGFVNPAELNFQLRDDSPIFTRIPGFHNIPFKNIGPAD